MNNPLASIATEAPPAPVQPIADAPEPEPAPQPPLRTLAFLAAGLAGATALTTLLPWLKATVLFATVSLAGFEADDGKAVAVLGLAGAGLAGLAIRRQSARYLVGAGVAALLALLFAGHVAYNIAGADAGEGAMIQYGAGLVLAMLLSLAGVGLAIYTTLRVRRSRQR